MSNLENAKKILSEQGYNLSEYGIIDINAGGKEVLFSDFATISLILHFLDPVIGYVSYSIFSSKEKNFWNFQKFLKIINGEEEKIETLFSTE